jgi:hypothetical protein
MEEAPKNHKESFVRWQDITITQLGYAVNLCLTFSTAALGFSLSLLTNNAFNPSGDGKFFFDVSLLSLMISVACGIYCVINRLADFRKTRGIALSREEMESDNIPEDEINSALAERREESKKKGNVTWTFLRIQLIAFGVGVACLSIAFAIIYSAKLF